MRGKGRKSSKREQRMPRWRRHSARTLAPGSNLERQATNTRPFTLNYDCNLSRSIIDPSRQLSLSGCTDQHKESTTQHFTSRNVANHRVFKSEVAANFDLREKKCVFHGWWLSMIDTHELNQTEQTTILYFVTCKSIRAVLLWAHSFRIKKNSTAFYVMLCIRRQRTTPASSSLFDDAVSSQTKAFLYPANIATFQVPTLCPNSTGGSAAQYLPSSPAVYSRH